jgi:sugar/nucleoside kinase (ribokinase family)
MSILAVGSVAFDCVKTPSGVAQNVVGGSNTYFSIAASFFSDVNIVAVVGDDFDDKAMKVFEGRAIDLEGLEKKPGKTFLWKGEYPEDNINEAITHATELNVFSDFSPKIPERYKKSRVLFLANIDPDLQGSVLEQVESPALIACDTMNHWIRDKRDALGEILKSIDLLIINDGETKLLSGEKNQICACEKILDMGVKKIISKKGEHGAVFMSKDTLFTIPAYPHKKVVDPTGAGDTFAGGVIGYLDSINDFSDEAIKRGILYGTIVASYTIEDFSMNRLLRLNKKDIEKRVEEFAELMRF